MCGMPSPNALRSILVTALLLLACSPPEPTSPAASVGEFAGAYDEIIGADGRAAAGFSDADYVQLLRPDDIPPIYAPEFVAAPQASLPDDELVIVLSINGDARAYPAGILYTREMVNDVVGDVPVLVSWCPRCYTALVHRRPMDATGSALVFGNQGALYQGAMTWYDHGSGSVWSQPLGMAIAGPAAGRTLSLLPSQLTTWREWRTAHPDTLALVVDEPAPPFRGRRPGPEHLVAVVVGDAAAAWPYQRAASGETIHATVGESAVTLWLDDATGGIRATATSADGIQRELPTLIAYRQAWLKLHPGSVINGN